MEELKVIDYFLKYMIWRGQGRNYYNLEFSLACIILSNIFLKKSNYHCFQCKRFSMYRRNKGCLGPWHLLALPWSWSSLCVHETQTPTVDLIVACQKAFLFSYQKKRKKESFLLLDSWVLLNSWVLVHGISALLVDAEKRVWSESITLFYWSLRIYTC